MNGVITIANKAITKPDNTVYRPAVVERIVPSETSPIDSVKPKPSLVSDVPKA